MRLWLGLALLAALGLGAAAAPLVQALLGHDPFAPDLFSRFGAGSAAHPLGTDELGRDVLLRLLFGARVSLAVGVAVALGATGLGTLVGLVAAWRGGWVDAVLMRLADGLLALPALPLLVVLAAVDTGRFGLPRGEAAADIARIVLILVAFGWVGVARLARAAALTQFNLDYVAAARVSGASEARVLLAARAAEHRRAGLRRRGAGRRRGDPGREHAELPGPRDPAAGAELGQHALQCAGDGLRRADGGGLAGAGDPGGGRRLHPGGGRGAARLTCCTAARRQLGCGTRQDPVQIRVALPAADPPDNA